MPPMLEPVTDLRPSINEAVFNSGSARLPRNPISITMPLIDSYGVYGKIMSIWDGINNQIKFVVDRSHLICIS
jgi:hypothetical protein